MKSMKKRIVPISSTDDQDCSVGSCKSNRNRIRLRRSSSKSSCSSSNNNKRQQNFNKRPFLYKSLGDLSPTKQNRSVISNTGIHLNGLIPENKYLETPVQLIDWIDTGMELFGCGISSTNIDVLSSDTDRSSSRLQSNGANTQLNRQQTEEDIAAIKQRHRELMERDYIQLHEDFFDALLKQEGDKMLESILTAATSLQQIESQSRDGTGAVTSAGYVINGVGSSSHSVTSGISSVSSPSAITAETNVSGFSTNNKSDNKFKNDEKNTNICSNRSWENGDKKKRRRRTNNGITDTFDEYDRLYNPDSNSATIEDNKIKSSSKNDNHNESGETCSVPSLKSASASASSKKSKSSSVLCIKDIMAKEHLQDPGNYINSNCRLQKDKGKGDRLESSISAIGKEACLEKLRDKIKLIVEVSGELQAPSFSNDLTSINSSLSKNNIVSNSNHGQTAKNDNGKPASNGKGMTAGMKRRRAKIALIERDGGCSEGLEDGSCIIETRSMIELQLGFLSMQYGLLLRWDAYRTGQITYVCLRKMCHDSFYSKIPPSPLITTRKDTTKKIGKHKIKNNNKQPLPMPPRRGFDNESTGPPRIIDATKKREIASPLVVRSQMGGNHAIYQRASGATEVVLVDAPYRVPQPEAFSPSILSLDIHQLTGLDPKSRWTLSMTFDGHTEIAHLNYNQQDLLFETTRTSPCKWEMMMVPQKPVTSFDIATGLEIRLFEQRPKQRLRGVVPVGGMVRKSSSSASLLVPPGTDPFDYSSNSCIIQNQRLIQNCNSENSVGSSNTVTGSISSRNSLKKSTSRLASTMTVPLGGLLSQPSTTQTACWKLTIPFTHSENAHVNLTLMHQSDYAHWLYRELRARRKEESAIGSAVAYGESRSGPDLWHSLISSSKNPREDGLDGRQKKRNDSDLFLMDWLIYCC